MNVKKTKEKGKRLSEAQLDFIKEMMNVGAGNAATALTKMLQCKIDVKIPGVHAFAVSQVPSLLTDPSQPVACVSMSMVGEVTGGLFFIVPDDQKTALIRLAERATGMQNSKPRVHIPKSDDLSVLTEIGSILAGVYLTAIHDFCKLNICHTVPRIGIDMIQSLLDESLATISREVEEIIIVVNNFIPVEEDRINSFLLVIPSPQSVKTLVDSIEDARSILING